MKRLAIIGSRDLGEQIAYHARIGGFYTPVCFFDDFEENGTIRHGVRVAGNTEHVLQNYKAGVFDEIMIAIGYKHVRRRGEIFDRFNGVIPFANIVHASSHIDPSCELGQGVFIFPGCTLDMNVVIGDNVLVNAGCTIGHHSKIGRNSFISPGVTIAGFVKVGANVNLGIGTIVIDNVSIGEDIRTGGGATVVDDLSEPGLYVGVPARIKSTNI